MDLDEVFPKIGECGRYQKLLLCSIIFPLFVPTSFVTFNQLFMTLSPNHWCSVPALTPYISDPEVIRNLAIPLVEGKTANEKCLRYAVNWTDLFEGNITFTNLKPDSSWPVESCLDGWVYNLKEVSSSIVIDFNLVCENDIYPTIGLVLLNLGGPIGVFIFGIINDRFGRKCSLFICLAVCLVSNAFSALASGKYFWMMTRFIVGLTVPALYHITFILALEIVGPSYRSFITVISCSIFTVGLMLLSGLIYFVPNWKLICILTSSPFFLFFLSWWHLPESPRWLLATGQNEKALIVLQTIAKRNKKKCPSFLNDKELSPLQTKCNEDEENIKKKNVGILDLFKTPNMRLKTLVVTFLWFVNEIVYIGLNYYGPALGNDSNLSFLLSALVEIPGNILCWFIMDKWGRKLPLSVLMIISGISCTLTVLLPTDAQNLILALFLCSKFAISASFLLMYTFAAELFPTEARGIGLATAAYFSGVGRIFIPFITYLGSDVLVLPLVILGILSVFGGVFSLRLPETLNQSLPQTIEEGEEFGKHWSLKDCVKFK